MLLSAAAGAALVPARAAAPGADLDADTARRDLRIQQRALLALHPGLERYTSLQALDAEFVAANAAVAGGASRGDMLLLASGLAAVVRCGHTWTNPVNQRDDLVALLAAQADKLPLPLRWVVSGRRLRSTRRAPCAGTC